MWRPGDTRCFSFVLTPVAIEPARRLGQTAPVVLDGSAMLLFATRAAIRRNPEIGAVLATYGVFLGALFALAWMMA